MMPSGGAEARLVLLPGLGADHRLFEDQAAEFPGLETPCLVPNEPGESLTTYSHRFAAMLAGDGPLFLGGLSFGGMVAMEAARAPVLDGRVKGVFMISGCRTHRAVTPEFRRRVGALQLVPDTILRASIFALSRSFPRDPDLSPRHRTLLMEMAREFDLGTFRWGAWACATWQGEEPPPDPPVFQIHGRHDDVIPLVEGDPDRVVEDGGHLIQFAQAMVVNAYIREKAAGLGFTFRSRS